MGYALRDDKRHSYADYRAWPDDARYELIEGAAFLMAPAPTIAHQTVVFDVARQLADALDARDCRVLLSPVDVLLPRGNEADDEVTTVVQPDLMVVCDAQKIGTRQVRGAPDWIMEVLSPSSAGHDQIVKLAAYERAGVREYWLVQPTDRVLTIYRHDGRGYGRATISELNAPTPVGVLPGVAIDWARVLDKLGLPET